MNREAFERQIADWLDAQHDSSLRARLDAAIQAEPRLADVLAEWQTFDRLMRAGMPTPRGVDWARLRSVVSAGVDASANPDAALDEVLGQSSTIEHAINWSRLKDRISVAVRADASARRRSRSRTLWLGGVAATTLTAAAALILALLPTATPPSNPMPSSGFARVMIAAPVATPARGIAIARITGGDAPKTPQTLFMIDPPTSASSATVDDSAEGYF